MHWMREAHTDAETMGSEMLSGRLVALIGAGASKDAGLPLMSQLAENILRRVNKGGQTQVALTPSGHMTFSI